MLTPLDIHNKEFKRSFRGYSEEEVDEFLDLVVAEFERLLRENEDLKAKNADLDARLQHYKTIEETLQNAIVVAQQAADELKAAARREAAVIKEQAEIEARKIKERAEREAASILNRVSEARQTLGRFNAELKALLRTYLDMLEKATASMEAALAAPFVETAAARAKVSETFKAENDENGE
ncbi:MAG: DivIVA domain-containing protein [Firmicutes bacterium]|nr:DivIVA domain-containing protein [Candidatus Fermentithermobacillaceae bacterium]